MFGFLFQWVLPAIITYVAVLLFYYKLNPGEIWRFNLIGFIAGLVVASIFGWLSIAVGIVVTCMFTIEHYKSIDKLTKLCQDKMREFFGEADD